MHPVLFSTDLFGLLSEPFKLHTYGLLIAGGFLLAMNLSKRQAEREGEDPDRIVDLAFYLLLAGLIGSRIVFILTKFDEYMRNPLDIVMFWRGGLVWYGGFIGAATYLIYYSRKHRLDYFKVVDILIPYMAMAHAFGRLGCLAAGCCFGRPAEGLPWGIVFPSDSMTAAQQTADGLVGSLETPLPVHPTQLYESGAELTMFALLLFLRPHKRFHGQLFLTWLAIYPVLRSIIEVFRGDKERGVFFILSTSQWISIGVAIAAVVVFFRLRSRRAEQSRALAALPSSA
jgi:phosphatidylglycerol:prolipoprotein diacylglycerol transferase